MGREDGDGMAGWMVVVCRHWTEATSGDSIGELDVDVWGRHNPDETLTRSSKAEFLSSWGNTHD
mgnify:CR=1 FL=1